MPKPKLYKVTRVIDGDTFVVSPKWRYKGITGNKVRPIGYDTPEKGQHGSITTKKKLQRLILNKNVSLRKPVSMSYGRLVCDVYVGRKNLASFFERYE